MGNTIDDAKFYAYYNKVYTELTNSGKAPWMKEGIPERDIAFNPVSGVRFKGANSDLLEMEAAKKGYKDNRWVSSNECEEFGFSTRYKEEPTPIAYINKYVHPTDVNPVTGKELPKEKQKYYFMYNIEQLKECELTKSLQKTFSYEQIAEKTQNIIKNAQKENVAESISYYGDKSALLTPQMANSAKTLTEFRLAQELRVEYKPPAIPKTLQMENLLNKSPDGAIRCIYDCEVQKDRALSIDNNLEKGLRRTVEKDRNYSKSMEMSM